MGQIFNILTVGLVLSLAIAAAPALASGNYDHSAKFGGVVVSSKVGDIEIVAKPDSIRIHINDHGKAAKLEGAKAKVTLLNGAEKSEIELTPAGDKLEAKGTFKVAKGTKGIALVTLAGKPTTTARFEIK